MNNLFFKEEKEIETYKIPKKPSHFDIYGKMVKGEKISKEDKKYFDGFLFINQLSFNRKFLPYSVMLNSLPLNNEQLFEYAKFLAPIVGFNKFIKKNKTDSDLLAISWYFKVNLETAKRYKQYLSKKELKEINELYKEQNG